MPSLDEIKKRVQILKSRGVDDFEINKTLKAGGVDPELVNPSRDNGLRFAEGSPLFPAQKKPQPPSFPSFADGRPAIPQKVDANQVIDNQNIDLQKKSAGGFVQNIGSSFGKNIQDIGGAVVNTFNPDLEKNTVANLGKAAIGGVELMIPGEQGHEDRARAIGQYYADRYGGAENIADTMYKDPVGFLLDVSALIGGGGAILSGVGKAGKLASVSNAGKALTGIAAATDPLQAVGRIARVPIKAGAGKMADIGEKIGKDSILAAIRPSKTQANNFEKLTNTALEDFMRKNKLSPNPKAAARQANYYIESLQSLYNDLTRSGKQIDPSNYIQKLRDQAGALRQSDLSPETARVADKLDDFAQKAEEVKASSQNGTIPIDVLTNTKTSQFGGVPGTAMIDPTSQHASKIAGGIALGELDKLAPGSQMIGQQLQALREFKEIAEKSAQAGKGTMIRGAFSFNLGFGFGSSLLGYAFGNPVAGAVVGWLGSQALKNPTTAGIIGKVAEKTGQALPGIERGVSTGLRKAEEVGRYSTRVSPVSNTYNEPNSNSQVNPPMQGDVSNYKSQDKSTHIGKDSSINSPTNQPSYLTGFSPEQIGRALSKAYMAGDTKAAAKIKALYDLETDYQKNQSGSDTLSLSDTAIKNITDLQAGLRDIENLSGDIEGSGAIGVVEGLRGLNPFDVEARSLQANIDRVRQVVGKALEGGVLRKEDEEKYKKILPTINDSKEVARNKLDQLKIKLNNDLQNYILYQKQYGKGAYNTAGSTQLQFANGQPLF